MHSKDLWLFLVDPVISGPQASLEGISSRRSSFLVDVSYVKASVGSLVKVQPLLKG